MKASGAWLSDTPGESQGGRAGSPGLGWTLHKWWSQWPWSPMWLEEQRQLAGGERLGRKHLEDAQEERRQIPLPTGCQELPFAPGGCLSTKGALTGRYHKPPGGRTGSRSLCPSFALWRRRRSPRGGASPRLSCSQGPEVWLWAPEWLPLMAAPVTLSGRTGPLPQLLRSDRRPLPRPQAAGAAGEGRGVSSSWAHIPPGG